MGIIKKICFLYLIISAITVSSQNHSDTVSFSNKKFIKHIVKAGESLRSISDFYSVTTSDIKMANELNARLFYNQILYIPVYLNDTGEDSLSTQILISNEEKPDNSITNIALLMPYYLPFNDSVFNNDTLNYSNTYSFSESALSFHVGVNLALDSLREIGMNIVLHTFDTNQDSLVVKSIINSGQLNNMDIIIGPMYSNLFHIICKKFGQDTTKILVSPLSRDNGNLRKFPSVYQTSLTYKVQADILTDFLIDTSIDDRVIILHDNINHNLAKYILHKFKKHNKIVDSFKIIDTSVDSIRKYFVSYQNVLLISKNKAFISKMLGSIGSIDSTSNVFTFESITSYKNLDITNLMELNVHIPNSRNTDLNSFNDRCFVRLFEKKYNTNIRKYSKEGYDIIMHFCGHSYIYNFKKYTDGYNENIYAPIYKYSDYNLVPLK